MVSTCLIRTSKCIFRSEESGTPSQLHELLSAAAPEQLEAQASKSFPTAVGQGANGSAGVVDEVSQIDGAITYVESGFAKDKNLGILRKLDFGEGPVELNKDTVSKALDSVKFSGEGNNLVVDSEGSVRYEGNRCLPWF